MKQIKVQTKALTVDAKGVITGIAWPFGAPDSYGDVIAAGAFKVRGHVPMLWDHDHGQPIGIWESIKETARGLEVRGRLLIEEVERAAEVFALIKSGAIRGLSIGFWPLEATKNGFGGDDITSLDLLEISCVSIPAHPEAVITSAKSANGGKGKKLTKANVRRTNAAAIKKTNKAAELEADNDNEELLNDEGDDTDIGAVDDRVSALEAEVAEIRELVEGTNTAVEDVAKSVRILVTKSGRPGSRPQQQETPQEAKRKAFISYLRHGDKSPDVKALTTAVDPKAGYVAPPEFTRELVRELVIYSPIRQYARVGSTGSGSVIIPGRVGTSNAQWVGRNDDTPESDFGFDETEIFIHELATYIPVPNSTLADSVIDLEGEIRTAFSEDLGVKEGRAFLYGTGVKEPEGILTRTDIEALVTTSSSAIAPEELIDLLYSMPAQYRNAGTWGMNGTTLGQLRKLKDLEGRFIWAPGLADGQPESILGRPVLEIPDMPDIEAGALPIIYGDWSGYRIYDRESMDVLVDPYTASKQRKTNFLVNQRVGGGLVEPKKFRTIKMKP